MLLLRDYVLQTSVSARLKMCVGGGGGADRNTDTDHVILQIDGNLLVAVVNEIIVAIFFGSAIM